MLLSQGGHWCIVPYRKDFHWSQHWALWNSTKHLCRQASRYRPSNLVNQTLSYCCRAFLDPAWEGILLVSCDQWYYNWPAVLGNNHAHTCNLIFCKRAGSSYLKCDVRDIHGIKSTLSQARKTFVHVYFAFWNTQWCLFYCTQTKTFLTSVNEALW